MQNPTKTSSWLSTLRKLCVLGAALMVAGAAFAGNLVGRYATITVDGSLSDWLPGDVLYSASEIGAGAPLETTFTNVYVANDADYVYVALQLPAPASITNTWTYNLFADTDMNPATGFNGGWMGGGYDTLVQYGAAGTTYSVYNFAGAAQADWTWNWNTLITYASTDQVIEWAIPRNALGLTTNKMRMEFNVTGTGTTTETWAYQWESGVATYTLATPPSTNPPAIAAVEAAPNQVVVSFSKAVDPVTAAVTANYSLSDGLTVLSATPSTTDPKKVKLATSAQTRGSVYVLSVSGVKDTTGASIVPNSRKAFVSSIVVDGSVDDWEGLSPLAISDPGNPTATDFKDVCVYNDANYIYFRLALWEPSDLTSAQNNIFIDSDNNPGSGNVAWGGSELLIQGTLGYQEKNGGFNEGQINGLDWFAANTGQTNWEFRISRAATYASDGQPVFTPGAGAISFALDGESNWVTVNRMPAGGTIVYTLADVLAAPLGPLSIQSVGGKVTVTWSGPGTLQARDSLVDGAWTNVPSATSPYTPPASSKQTFFRLVQ